VVIPFFTFRIMVGMGLAMLAISWFGNWPRWRGWLETTRCCANDRPSRRTAHRRDPDGGGRPCRDGDRQPSCCGELAMDPTWLANF
jgi:hypothetical protein